MPTWLHRTLHSGTSHWGHLAASGRYSSRDTASSPGTRTYVADSVMMVPSARSAIGIRRDFSRSPYLAVRWGIISWFGIGHQTNTRLWEPNRLQISSISACDAHLRMFDTVRDRRPIDQTPRLRSSVGSRNAARTTRYPTRPPDGVSWQANASATSITASSFHNCRLEIPLRLRFSLAEDRARLKTFSLPVSDCACSR